MMNIEERKGILKKQGQCFISLQRSSHLVRNCNSKIPCLACQGHHHLAVCDGRGACASKNSDSAVDSTRNCSVLRRLTVIANEQEV